jgi:hypothetical protein
VSAPSLCDRLESYLRERPNTWIDGRQLATIAGNYAWRTRVSDLRRQRALDIQNRTRRTVKPDGSHYTVSEYRLVLPEAQLSLLEA